MLKRIGLIACVAISVSTASVSAASKPPKPPKTLTVPVLSVNPHAAKPHARYTVSGVRFEPGKLMQIEMYCPQFGNKTHGYQKFYVKVDNHGAFSQKRTVPTPVKARSAICHLYALDITKKGAFYVSVEFDIK